MIGVKKPIGINITSTDSPGNHTDDLCSHPLVYCGDKHTIGIKEAYNEYEEAHDIIFGERNGGVIDAARQMRIAKFICGKIYREFLYESIDDTIVEDLAIIFINNNF